MARTVLTPLQVKEIREQINPYNARKLAQQYNVSYPTLQNAVMGRGGYGEIKHPAPLQTWIQQVPKRHADSKIKDAERAKIKKLWEQDNWTNADIAERFGISTGYVSQIVNGWHDRS